MTTWLILTRAIHIGSCLLFFGLFAFERFIAPTFLRQQSEMARYWETRLRLFGFILLPIILVSWAAWFALVAMTMSGQPLQMDILKIVWSQTQFGTVWKIRLVFLLAAATLSFFLKPLAPFRPFAVWVQVIASGCLLGSLAWAGHGQ
jgi:putative copper export protein